MKIENNFPSVIHAVESKIAQIDLQRATALAASSLLATLRVRIHKDGIASDGSQIGQYSPKYMRKRYEHGRNEGRKVVLSLTRAMENSEELYPLENGTGIGFSTDENWQKAVWCEGTYGKKIFAPTQEETAMVVEICDDYIKSILE